MTCSVHDGPCAAKSPTPAGGRGRAGALAGCGDDDAAAQRRRGPRRAAPVRLPAVLGGPQHRRPCGHEPHHGARVRDVGYGTCKASSDSGCALRSRSRRTRSATATRSIHGRRPSSSRRVRGVIARADGEGTIEIPTGTSNVTVCARPDAPRARAGRAAPGPARARARLPSPATRSSTSTSCVACAMPTSHGQRPRRPRSARHLPARGPLPAAAWPRAGLRAAAPAGARVRRRALRGRAWAASTRPNPSARRGPASNAKRTGSRRARRPTGRRLVLLHAGERLERAHGRLPDPLHGDDYAGAPRRGSSPAILARRVPHGLTPRARACRPP